MAEISALAAWYIFLYFGIRGLKREKGEGRHMIGNEHIVREVQAVASYMHDRLPDCQEDPI